MATTGKKFLRLNGWDIESLEISGHALVRFKECSGSWIEDEEIREVFLKSEHVKVDDVYKLGFSPGYKRRKKQGTDSWYFSIKHNNVQLLAVIGRKDDGPIWVTTYGADEQTNLMKEWRGG